MKIPNILPNKLLNLTFYIYFDQNRTSGLVSRSQSQTSINNKVKVTYSANVEIIGRSRKSIWGSGGNNMLQNGILEMFILYIYIYIYI